MDLLDKMVDWETSEVKVHKDRLESLETPEML